LTIRSNTAVGKLDVMVLISPRTLAATSVAWLAVLAFGSDASADADFDRWTRQLWRDAQNQGISQATFDSAIAGIQLDLSLPDLVIRGRPSKEQAEFSRLPADYLPALQLAGLAKAGRRHLSTYKGLLQRIEAEYGVPGSVVVAIWGRETDYGAEPQRLGVIRSLVTEAYLGRRKEMFRNELLTALQLVQNGTIRIDAKGSWSGAMGQTQFVPSDFKKFAVDFDEDGKIDLTNSIPDALASGAKQLRDYGWKRGKQWGFEVRLPEEISCLEASADISKPIGEWMGLGLMPAAGSRIFREMLDEHGSLVLPAGIYGPAFLTLENFRVLRRYNASDLYAIFVGHLADLIDGGRDFERQWTRMSPYYGRDIEAIQKLLSSKKYYSDKIDGRLGSATRRAIGLYQQATNVPIDCWPSKALLEQLRQDGKASASPAHMIRRNGNSDRSN
jgi:lytic murein transglycosylase